MYFSQRIKLKQLRAFVAVYRLQRLAAAAEQLSITPSAVSILIRQLEDNLQTTLFDRSGRVLRPTLAADEAVIEAERILRDISLFGESFHERAGLRKGRLRIAVTPSVGVMVMPAGVRRFNEIYPQIQLIIEDCSPTEFLALILTKQVDLGIGIPEQIISEIEVSLLEQDPLYVVCTHDHPLAAYEKICWQQLDDVPMIALRSGYGVRHQVDAAAQQQGVQLRLVNEVNFSTSALWMAAAGIGVAILPSYLTVGPFFPNLVARPLIEPVLYRSVYAVNRKNQALTPAAERFIAIMKEVHRDALSRPEREVPRSE